ncbi:glycerophosphoryl diester phosphodiesterase/endonuclease/exonuclease/phosphatase family metal-dependent hydrolase [Lewinella aquimaris]|uniref:Glycerophosphoryl diester phosphodiesterase/endonuclease/exonuclease/phosphatase family metal-dependent hydrolase n=1 Tax=Neolewinella aquimaris TaxID=1835722 RepID=A0A840EFS4_9BACT|nr:glycerophosphodiester phosphodiesterase family protein [Neolewinella aquimaris]MBB4080659.1 glycerophosphoryl diester phosphodiesterase/endonuclease/exonuclease/phosphatase family metal-dependent hydrolase [Neolewinella aquimaris]
MDKEQAPLEVMSYNIRLNVASDGENAWPNRREFLVSQVLFHAPDIIGTQEVLPDQLAYLKEKLTPYAVIGEGREGGDAGEYSALFYDRRKFSVEEGGTFWLSPTPDAVASVGWDAALPRIVTYGRFRDRTSGQEFMAFNTHFDHRGEQARVESARLITQMMDSLNQQNLPVVLTGDLNLTPETAAIQTLTDSLVDAYAAAPVRLGPSGTFTGFDHATPAERRIDYIMVSPGIRVRKFATLTDAVDGRYPSDHFAVVASLDLCPRPLIVAHRGASGHAVENSLPAFQKAIELGAEMTELDVWRLKDGTIVVHHDSDLKRLSDTEGKIEDYTLEDLNQVMLAGAYKIPRLRDVLMLVDKRMMINVELKGANTAEGTYELIREFIDNHGWKIEDFQISSFRHDELKRMRELSPDIDIAILPHGNPLDALAVAQEVGAIAINAYHGGLTKESVDAIHAAGLLVNAWTVNEKADMRRLRDLGVDGFITNYPDRVRALD